MDANDNIKGSSPDCDGGLDSLDRELSGLAQGDSQASAEKNAPRFGAEGWRLNQGRWICTPHNRKFCKVCSAIAPTIPAPDGSARGPGGLAMSRRPEFTGVDLPNQLERLGLMHERGLLNDDEFAAAKRKLLGS